jgi:hypothetical protein
MKSEFFAFSPAAAEVTFLLFLLERLPALSDTGAAGSASLYNLDILNAQFFRGGTNRLFS